MTTPLLDPTYRLYSPTQATAYAKHRPSPPPALVSLILDHHAATGGKTDTLLDVGCGPGMATRVFAPHFGVAIGSDAGESMIRVASELGGVTATGAPVRWIVSAAEEIDRISGVGEGSVDLVIAAYAAHWFDMPAFWTAAARILKPGGTVALWTGFRDTRVLPKSPEEAKVRAIFERFHEEVLERYAVAGSQITRDGYRNLTMPWGVPSSELSEAFEKDSFLRRELDRDDLAAMGGSKEGNVEETAKKVAADPLATTIWKRVENFLETLDPVTRWREAHPQLAGTEEDCVRVLVRETVEAVKEGKEGIDFRNLLVGRKTVVLCVKRV
ncbi:trans-aconitate 3-methyltransferase [Echria macrotheca]|uniref:Trans-aconitate 3-methyltransferase n=1 Tax=Echria macrotheca TaxID=438768 RepID=A0AAJ0F7C5_9PEZI|nr:trans-aconitate 3-methyltransferase [Echria macrotheca]